MNSRIREGDKNEEVWNALKLYTGLVYIFLNSLSLSLFLVNLFDGFITYNQSILIDYGIFENDTEFLLSIEMLVNQFN